MPKFEVFYTIYGYEEIDAPTKKEAISKFWGKHGEDNAILEDVTLVE